MTSADVACVALGASLATMLNVTIPGKQLRLSSVRAIARRWTETRHAIRMRAGYQREEVQL